MTRIKVRSSPIVNTEKATTRVVYTSNTYNAVVIQPE